MFKNFIFFDERRTTLGFYDYICSAIEFNRFTKQKNCTMKKLLVIVAVAAMFAACGGNKAANADTTAVDTAVVADTTAVDTAAAVDTTAAAVVK